MSSYSGRFISNERTLPNLNTNNNEDTDIIKTNQLDNTFLNTK